MSNNKYKVLIIEDEQNINNLLDTLMQARLSDDHSHILRKRSYDVCVPQT